MSDRGAGRLRAALACVLAALLVGCTAMATGPGAVDPGAQAPTGGTPVRVLQMNLCNSGIADCYTGRATTEAAAAIRAVAPDLVTLNEICEDDVAPLQQALADARPGTAVVAAFEPARNARTQDAYHCRNGRQYGIGMLSRWAAVPGSTADRGIYPTQDAEDPEQRAWLCLDLAAPTGLTACTTHLAYTDREVAVAQCRHLFDTVHTGRRAPFVLGGDLNLGSGDGADLRSCLPTGFAVAGDGGQQHVVTSPAFAAGRPRTVDLHGATDHPGLLVALTPR